MKLKSSNASRLIREKERGESTLKQQQREVEDQEDQVDVSKLLTGTVYLPIKKSLTSVAQFHCVKTT